MRLSHCSQPGHEGEVIHRCAALAESSDSVFSRVAGVTGLEPAASGVTGRRSNQTELHPRCMYPCRSRPQPRRSAGRPDVLRHLAGVKDARAVRLTSLTFGNERDPGLGGDHNESVRRRKGVGRCAVCPKFGSEWPATRSRWSKGWWAMTGSNRRPLRCKRSALPAELIARLRWAGIMRIPSRNETCRPKFGRHADLRIQID